jgi:hypothetical protein
MSTTPEAMLDEEICPSVTIALGKKEYRLAFSMGSVIAHVNLGLSKKDFLAMSPKEFHALTKCYWERIGHLSPRISRPAGRCSLTKSGVLQLRRVELSRSTLRKCKSGQTDRGKRHSTRAKGLRSGFPVVQFTVYPLSVVIHVVEQSLNLPGIGGHYS